MAFVTDGLLRKSVVACQSLGRRGVDVAVGSTTRLAPALFSRYCRQRLVYPSPIAQPDAFVAVLLDYLGRHRHDILLPSDDVTLALISRHREAFERVTHVPIPDAGQLAYGLDKARAMLLAERLGIPYPRTAFVQSPDEAQAFATQLGRQVLIKPRSSSGGRGIVYPFDMASVGDAWGAVHARYPFPLVQECIPNGPRYDVCVVVDRQGQAVASFVQKELRHFPVRDGMSTLQESVWRPDLVERTLTLLREIGWYGLVEVEYMEHPLTGEALLLEINPRLWASVRLAVTCGVDFPYLLYQVGRGRPVMPVHDYAVGRRCRWLLPGDVLHFLANPDRMKLDPPFFAFDGETVYDGLYGEDAGATIGVGLSCGHYLLDKDLWSLIGRGRRRAEQSTRQGAPDVRTGVAGGPEDLGGRDVPSPVVSQIGG
jgi:predicted ATP-grasp superfamily ATP-dependent carboligase